MKKKKEIKTVDMMIHMYCHGKHKTKKDCLCEECSELLEFVKKKREKCPFGDDKNYCSVCKIHCYQSDPAMRARIREVMKYAAPRMCFTHPILTISHLSSTIKAKREAKKAEKLKVKKEKVASND